VITEAALQRYFKRQCAAHKIYWRKLKFEGRRGAPDNLIAITGRAMFVELKSPSGLGKLSKLQEREIGHMRDAGLDVRVIQSKEEVDDIIKELTDG